MIVNKNFVCRSMIMFCTCLKIAVADERLDYLKEKCIWYDKKILYSSKTIYKYILQCIRTVICYVKQKVIAIFEKHRGFKFVSDYFVTNKRYASNTRMTITSVSAMDYCVCVLISLISVIFFFQLFRAYVDTMEKLSSWHFFDNCMY